MNKNILISLVIFFITFLLPFRFAVLDVEADGHGLSTFGVFFTAIGFLAGFYYLMKGDEKGNKDHGHEGSH